MPLVIWAAAALAMVVYAMALPERYDIACGAYAFTLIVTLAETGEHSVPLLASRAWETLLGATLGLAAGILLLPLSTLAQALSFAPRWRRANSGRLSLAEKDDPQMTQMDLG